MAGVRSFVREWRTGQDEGTNWIVKVVRPPKNLGTARGGNFA